MSGRPLLLFVSPRFLLPADSGGKIRTGQILRGLKGGHFELVLVSPAPTEDVSAHTHELTAMCDRFSSWPELARGRLFPYLRMRHIFSPLPISVATDVSTVARKHIAGELEKQPDLVVIDFTHTTVLVPARLPAPSVLFTHNVEAEIFARHLDVTTKPLLRMLWRNQLEKMQRFEKRTLGRYDAVVAVSERDRSRFKADYHVDAEVIATGVDLDFFAFQSPLQPSVENTKIVFTASMDSYANIDGVQWFMDAVWPLVARAHPGVSVTIAGRNPDPKLVRQAKDRKLDWIFTGSVDDIRPFVYDAAVYIIPLRVGGGTRIKAYEAMALGRPVVSTTVGAEGLELEPGKHYLAADTAEDFAASVTRLLADTPMRVRLATDARKFVEQRFSARQVAKSFEAICRSTIEYVKRN